MSIPGLNLTTPSWTSSSQLNSAYMLTIVGGVADATIDLANVRRMPKMRFVFLQTRALVARRTQPAQNVDHHPQSNSQCQLVEVKRRLMQIQLQPPSGHTPSRATAPGISSRILPAFGLAGIDQRIRANSFKHIVGQDGYRDIFVHDKECTALIL